MPKLIVISRQRSGSTAVMELLGSHPQINNLGELMNPNDQVGLPVDEQQLYNYVNEKLSRKHDKFALVDTKDTWSAFKVHIHQHHEQNFSWDKLMKYCWIDKAIIVWRKEIVETIVSEQIASLTGEWYNNGTIKSKFASINLKAEFLKTEIEKDIQNWTNVFEHWPIELCPIFIQYEELFGANNETTISQRFEQVFEKLGVDECDYAECYCQRQNPDTLDKKVSNWYDLPVELREQQIDVPAIFESVISQRFGLPKELVNALVPDQEPCPPKDGFQHRVAAPYIPNECFSYVNDALRSGQISSASQWPKKLSEKLCELFGMPVAVPCSNGFTSLVLALQSANIGQGDEVLVPSFTMIAVPNAVRFVGAQPVFIDNENGEYNPSWNQIKESITLKTKGIIISHTYGSPAKDISVIAEECQKRGIILIEDISEAVGIKTAAPHGQKMLGTFGDYACASMYVNKMLHSGDGGFVLARDPTTYSRLQSILNHGFTKSFHFVHFEVSINGKINGLGAAVACGVLEHFDHIINHRRSLAKWYRKYLSPLTPKKIELMPACGIGDTPWVFGLHCESKQARTLLRAHLAKKGIETRDYFFPMHLQPAFRHNDASLQRLPNSEKIGSTGFYLPTHTNLTKETVKMISHSIIEFFGDEYKSRPVIISSNNGQINDESHQTNGLSHGICNGDNQDKLLESKLNNHISEKSDLEDLLQKARRCFNEDELWDDKKNLSELFKRKINGKTYENESQSILKNYVKYFMATMDIEAVSTDSKELEEVLLSHFKTNFHKDTKMYYIGRNEADDKIILCIKNIANSSIHFEEVTIPTNGQLNGHPIISFDKNCFNMIIIYLDNISHKNLSKLTEFYIKDISSCSTLILLGGQESHLSFLTELAQYFELKEKHKNIRIYEPKLSPLINANDDWEELQKLWNVPFPRKMKFVGDPGWNHHHRNAYQNAIDALKQKFHDEDAEVLFISAVEQYICDCETTPKQPWVGVIHGISNNENHFYVPDLEKLCTKYRYRPWLNRCIGLFTLTSSQVEYLKKTLPSEYKFPITQLFYPSTPIKSTLDSNKILKKLVNQDKIDVYFIGSYDRNFNHFFEAKFPENLRKVLLECDIETPLENIPEDVRFANRANDEEYERILYEELIFLSLKNGGAANTLIIECIARNVPIIAPRMSSITDYIGEGYPLLYEIGRVDFTKLIMPSALQEAIEYLQTMDKSLLAQERFIEDIEKSSVLGYMRPFTGQIDFDVTISLCSYKRTHNLPEILNSLINNQSFKGRYEIIVWNNNVNRKNTVEKIIASFSESLKDSTSKRLELITSSRNHFCSIRFAMPQLMQSDKLLICDDDIIPGPDFIDFFVKNHQTYPSDVLCLRGNIFRPHEMSNSSPHEIWENYDAVQFVDDQKDECFVHYVHSDACLIPKMALREVASIEPPDTDFILVDDYWMSYILSAKFNRNLRKLKVVDNILTRTNDSDQIGVAMFTRKDVANAKTRMYIHHMVHGWPNFKDDETTPLVDEALKRYKSNSWNHQRIGFNINSEISENEIEKLVELGIGLVRVGIVGAGRDEGYEFSGLNSKLMDTIDEIEDLVKRLQKQMIDVVLVLDKRIATVKNWKFLSSRLASYKNVVGYDLFNEPYAKENLTQHWYQIRQENVEMDGSDCLRLFKELIKAIRSKDSVTPIIIETLFWANIATLDKSGVDELKHLDDNILASIHYYLPQALTWRSHNRGRFSFPGNIPIYDKLENSETFYCSGEFIDQEFKLIQNWINKMGIRVFIGEFGIARDISGADLYLEAIGNACKKYSLSACLYAFRDPDWEAMDYELGVNAMNYKKRSIGDDQSLYKVIRKFNNV